MYRLFFKRVLDILLSLTILIITSPFLLVVAVINYFLLLESPFFLQDRPGFHEKKIRIVKFKSMNNKKDVHGNLLPDNQRITSFGAFIRKTSIDELPQMFNVIIGDMSLIGPRPLLFRYIPLYDAAQKKRHDVKPGITGWAQVNGRNAISWEKKFGFDVWYVTHLSFLLDVKIIFLTIKNVLMAKEINQQGQATIEKFKG